MSLSTTKFSSLEPRKRQKKRTKKTSCCCSHVVQTILIVFSVMIIQGLLTLQYYLYRSSDCNQSSQLLTSFLDDFVMGMPTTTTNNGTKQIAKTTTTAERSTIISNTTTTTIESEHLEPSYNYNKEDDKTLLNNNNNNNFSGVMARAWDSWPMNQPLPCIQPDEEDMFSIKVRRSPSTEGFLMVKDMKTGGSTAAGVHLRIARNVANRMMMFPQQQQQRQYHDDITTTTATPTFCKVRFDHGRAIDYKYHIRNTHGKSFLWTIIREPTQRTISQFFHFQVSRGKIEPNDSNFQSWIEKLPLLHNHYLRILSLEQQENTSNRTQQRQQQQENNNYYSPTEVTNRIIQGYDFIGITERMEESIVALQLLLGLTTGDILFLNSKGSGGFDDGRSPGKGCVYIVKSFVSPGMKEYFSTNFQWRQKIYFDTLMHQAVNRSLDLTIERLGKLKFQIALDKFRHAQSMVQEKCLYDKTTIFPCGPDGTFHPSSTSCLWEDSGCGTPCLDQVAKELNLYEEDEEMGTKNLYVRGEIAAAAAAPPEIVLKKEGEIDDTHRA